MKGSALIFFARAPLPGKVKTRLARHIGVDAALDLYRTMGRDIITGITKPGSWDTLVCYSPPECESLAREWLGDIYPYHPQLGRDLGEKMHNALKEALDRGYTRVVLTGSDIPELSSSIIENAFSKLDSVDVVLGPASDGGYYLVGVKESRQDMFRNIRWSDSDVLEKTLDNLACAGLSYALVETLVDIDEIEDLRSFMERTISSRGIVTGIASSGTMRACENILNKIKRGTA